MRGMKIPFGIDTTGYRKGLAAMRSQTKSWGNDIRGTLMRAFAVGAVISQFRKAISFGSEMSDLATRTRTTVKEFMVFRDAARDAGLEQSILERALRNTNIRIQEAVDGNKSYGDAVRRLGLNLEQLQGKTTAEKFISIAVAAEAAADKSEAFEDVADLLGQRAGPALTEVLRRLAVEGFDKVAESATVMEDATAQALDQAEDHIQKLGDKITMAFGNFLGQIAEIKNTAKEIQDLESDLLDDRIGALMMIEDEQGYSFSYQDKDKLMSADTTDEERGRVLSQVGMDEDDWRKATSRASRKRVLRAQEKEAEAKAAKDKKAEEMRAAQEEQGRQVKRENLSEKLAEAEAKLAADRMSDQEKLNSLLEKEAELKAIANKESVEGLEAAVALVEVQTELDKLRPKAEKEQADKAAEIAGLKSDLQALDEEDRMSSLSPEERLKEMQKKHDSLLADARYDYTAGREADSIRKKISAAEMKKVMDDLKKEIEAEIPTEDITKRGSLPSIVTSSLQEVGGGGNIAAVSVDPVLSENRIQTSLLRTIADGVTQFGLIEEKKPVL